MVERIARDKQARLVYLVNLSTYRISSASFYEKEVHKLVYSVCSLYHPWIPRFVLDLLNRCGIHGGT